MVRYFIELAYNGSRYHGWQIQPGASSVQEEINRALSTLLRQDIYVVGAGRTDTGVHASFFVAHFDIECELPEPQQVVYKLNGLLDKDIAIYKIYRVPMDKHARFSAISRTYKYYIDKTKDPFTYPFAWKAYPLPEYPAGDKLSICLESLSPAGYSGNERSLPGVIRLYGLYQFFETSYRRQNQ